MTISETEIHHIVQHQRSFFNAASTLPYSFRINTLKNLKMAITDYEERLNKALKEDLGKSEFEAYVTEIGFTLHDLRHTINHLNSWMKPRQIKTTLITQPAKSQVRFTPLGVNLIISPFNYPVQLTLGPLTAAIAAGNTAILKTSELTPACSEVLHDLITDRFDPQHVAHVPGEIRETTALLKQKFDHIFFTGSPQVGSIVMAAAAPHLTPVTLELGGKSPCIVHSDARLGIAVNRIVAGKFINAGQTCVAPDYVLVHQSIQNVFLKKMTQRIEQCYGPDPQSSPDFGRIVNTRHHRRIVELIDPDKLVVGGAYNEEDRFIAPTVMTNVTLEDPVMSQEIFGPVLPVLSYETLEDIYTVMSQLPQHPLACYIFSESKAIQEALLHRIQCGGSCINHCLQHVANLNLPFGGVGQSGMGSYHGEAGFECFSHKKSVLNAATWIDSPLIYPPYKTKLKLTRMILK